MHPRLLTEKQAGNGQLSDQASVLIRPDRWKPGSLLLILQLSV